MNFNEYVKSQWPERTGLYFLITEYIPLIFIMLFLASLIFAIMGVIANKPFSKIKRENDQLKNQLEIISDNVEAVVNGLLLQLSNKLILASGEDSRITIYIHNGDRHFISFGRFSPNTAFRTKGRQMLPDNQGCVGKAWSNAWCYEGSLDYKQARKYYSITKDMWKQMRMKSKMYAAKRIDSNNRQPLALIVFESCIPNRFLENQIKNHLDNEEPYLASVIECLKEHIPDPSSASNRGF